MTSRVRPAVRTFAIVAFALLLPIAAHRIWDYVELRRLVNEIEAIQAKGEPVSEHEATGGPPPVSETDDAGSYYLAGAMLALGNHSSDATAPVLEWLAEPTGSRSSLTALAPPLEKIVTDSSDALALADKASALPFTGLPAGTEYSYRAASISALYTLINARTLSLSLAGDGDAAVESVLSGLHVRRALRNARWLRGPDLHVDAVLSLSQPSPPALSRLQTALEAEDRPEQSIEYYLRERARYVETMWRRYYGSQPNAPRHYTLPMRSVTESVMRPWISRRFVEDLRLWAKLTAVVRMPWPDRAQRGTAIGESYRSEQQASSRTAYGTYRSAALSALSQAVNPTALTIDRNTRIAVAVERYRRDQHRLPGALADLVPQYLSVVPLDPMSGGPLLFKATADSYTVYSVGPNQKDDGGDLTSQSRGVRSGDRGRRIVRGADVGVRVLIAQ